MAIWGFIRTRLGRVAGSKRTVLLWPSSCRCNVRERECSQMVRGHIHYIPESQVGKAIDMFNQYEAQFADISENQKMNSLMSSLNKATAIEHGPTSVQVSVVAAGGNSNSNSSEISEAALVSMAKFG